MTPPNTAFCHNFFDDFCRRIWRQNTDSGCWHGEYNKSNCGVYWRNTCINSTSVIAVIAGRKFYTDYHYAGYTASAAVFLLLAAVATDSVDLKPSFSF